MRSSRLDPVVRRRSDLSPGRRDRSPGGPELAAGQIDGRRDAAAESGRQDDPQAMPACQAAHHEQAEDFGRCEVEALTSGQAGVLLGEPLRRQAQPVVHDRDADTVLHGHR